MGLGKVGIFVDFTGQRGGRYIQRLQVIWARSKPEAESGRGKEKVGLSVCSHCNWFGRQEVWVQERQDSQWCCDPLHWWQFCTTKLHSPARTTGDVAVDVYIKYKNCLNSTSRPEGGNGTNVFCIVYCQKDVKYPFFNSNTLNILPVLKMTFLNSSGCTWINFSMYKWACGHLTLWNGKIMAIYYGIMKHVHD